MSELTLSYSKKDMFETCKYRYNLHYNERREASDVVMALFFGGLVHDVFARAEQTNKDPFEIYNKLAKTKKGFIDLPEYAMGLDLVGNWQEWKKNRPKDEIIKGTEIFFKIFLPSGILFLGKYDRISHVPSQDLWIITDYKTGKSKVPKKRVKDNLQLNAYIIGVTTKNKIPKEKIKAEFLYLKDLDVRSMGGNEAEISTIEKDIEKTYHEIMEEETFPRTNETWRCGWCEYSSLCKKEKGVF